MSSQKMPRNVLCVRNEKKEDQHHFTCTTPTFPLLIYALLRSSRCHSSKRGQTGKQQWRRYGPARESSLSAESNERAKERTTGALVAIERARNISLSRFWDFVGLAEIAPLIARVRVAALAADATRSRCCNDAWPLRFTAFRAGTHIFMMMTNETANLPAPSPPSTECTEMTLAGGGVAVSPLLDAKPGAVAGGSGHRIIHLTCIGGGGGGVFSKAKDTASTLCLMLHFFLERRFAFFGTTSSSDPCYGATSSPLATTQGGHLCARMWCNRTLKPTMSKRTLDEKYTPRKATTPANRSCR
jgi:hypothetical protein